MASKDFDRSIVLPQIQFKYFEKRESDEETAIPDLVCDNCGKINIPFGSQREQEDGGYLVSCEDCAIDEYQKDYGFSTRKAAEARRRRLFDVGYLLTEMLVDDYMREFGINDIDDLSQEAFEQCIETAKDLFNNKLTKRQQIRMEETVEQDEIERILEKKFNLGVETKHKDKSFQEGMNIPLDEHQYEVIIKAMQIAGVVYCVLDDMVDQSYRKDANQSEEVESYLLKFAERFDRGEFSDIRAGQLLPSDDLLEDTMDALNDYEEYCFWEELPRKLARRDFAKEYTQKQAEEMDDRDFMRKMHKIEKKYIKEFKDHGIERLVVNKEK